LTTTHFPISIHTAYNPTIHQARFTFGRCSAPAPTSFSRAPI